MAGYAASHRIIPHLNRFSSSDSVGRTISNRLFLPCRRRQLAFIPHNPLSQDAHLLPATTAIRCLPSTAPHDPLIRPSSASSLDQETLHALASDGYTGSSRLAKWDSTTARYAAVANLPFLLLQLPQIILNTRNLLSGNNSALLAIPWLGMLTGLLGNLSLLSYFVKKKESGAALIQALGVTSTYIVIAQLAAAGAMPWPHYCFVSVVVAAGMLLNFMNYFGKLDQGTWRLWEDFTLIGGLSVLPQVMWSTFVPYVPHSILPGLVFCAGAVTAVIMERTGKLSMETAEYLGLISGWTATLLFMWMPVAQMWTNYLHPANIKGLSVFTVLLAMMGNGLTIPRALFIRDLMWFTGATWGSFLHGWGNLLCMYCFSSISKELFMASSLVLCGWLGLTFWKDAGAYGYKSPFQSLKRLWMQ